MPEPVRTPAHHLNCCISFLLTINRRMPVELLILKLFKLDGLQFFHQRLAAVSGRIGSVATIFAQKDHESLKDTLQKNRPKISWGKGSLGESKSLDPQIPKPLMSSWFLAEPASWAVRIIPRNISRWYFDIFCFFHTSDIGMGKQKIYYTILVWENAIKKNKQGTSTENYVLTCAFAASSQTENKNILGQLEPTPERKVSLDWKHVQNRTGIERRGSTDEQCPPPLIYIFIPKQPYYTKGMILSEGYLCFLL